MNELFNKFKSICLELNKIKIIPTLIGSLGFEFITKVSWYPQDIDIHVLVGMHLMMKELKIGIK